MYSSVKTSEPWTCLDRFDTPLRRTLRHMMSWNIPIADGYWRRGLRYNRWSHVIEPFVDIKPYIDIYKQFQLHVSSTKYQGISLGHGHDFSAHTSTLYIFVYIIFLWCRWIIINKFILATSPRSHIRIQYSLMGIHRFFS